MRVDKFLKGIEIISNNIPESEKESLEGLHAEHDQIWFGSEEWVTDPLDIKTLDELGWFTDEDSWSCWT